MIGGGEGLHAEAPAGGVSSPTKFEKKKTAFCGVHSVPSVMVWRGSGCGLCLSKCLLDFWRRLSSFCCSFCSCPSVLPLVYPRSVCSRPLAGSCPLAGLVLWLALAGLVLWGDVSAFLRYCLINIQIDFPAAGCVYYFCEKNSIMIVVL